MAKQLIFIVSPRRDLRNGGRIDRLWIAKDVVTGVWNTLPLLDSTRTTYWGDAIALLRVSVPCTPVTARRSFGNQSTDLHLS